MQEHNVHTLNKLYVNLKPFSAAEVIVSLVNCRTNGPGRLVTTGVPISNEVPQNRFAERPSPLFVTPPGINKKSLLKLGVVI